MLPMVLFIPLIPGIQICCSAEAGDGHFCRPLMVAHEFRLCLHPRGMLRVQSLHLPVRAWLGVICAAVYFYHFTICVQRKQALNF